MSDWRERTGMLLGEAALAALGEKCVAVIGLGGVGAFAAEMVARAGVGRMVLLDSDCVSLSNKNRQLLALDSTLGRPKTEVLRERLLDINPALQLTVIDRYLDEENIAEILPQGIDFLIDAIDTLAPKLALIRHCVESRIPLVSSMGAGAKYDMTKVRIADLSKSFNCPLAYMVRKKLRKMGITKGFPVVFSEELPDENAIVEMSPEERAATSNKKSQVGTISYLPASFGCACAQAAIRYLTEK
ncbi:MAG: tRNA threonylcarbamoyladenosine dehydratase [Bacteroidales bacterium]|nr:tRNA threonylcarbamoyladenosine dehydratase [Bacteroidales bacterium]